MLNISSPDLLETSTRKRISKWLVDCRKSAPTVRRLDAAYLVLKVCDTLFAIGLASCLASLSLRIIGLSDPVLPIELSQLLVLGVALCCARALIVWGLEVLSVRGSCLICNQIRRETLRSVLNIGPSQTGAISYDFFEGIDAIHGYFSRYRPAVLSLAIAPPLICLTLLIAVDWFSGLVLLICGILVPAFSAVSGYRTAKLGIIEFDRLSQMSAYFLDRVSGLLVLRTLGQISSETSRIAEISENLRHTARRVLRVAFLPALTTDLILMGGLVIIAAHSVDMLVMIDQTSTSLISASSHQALVVLFLLPDFFLPFRRLSAHYHDRMRAFAAAHRLSKHVSVSKLARPSIHAVATPALTAPPSLEFRQFDGANLDLSEPVTLNIPAGSIVALTGPSGVGKSTLLNAVLGFEDQISGEILCNGEATSLENVSEKSHSQLSRLSDEWRRSLAWMGQNSHLFHGSVADNLSLSGAQNEQMRAAQKESLAELGLSHLDLESSVGQGGQLLSGGQRRRLLLARALLQRAPLLILDEPTAYLDTESEAICIRALAQRKGSATLLIASHSSAILDLADVTYHLKRREY